MINISDHIHSDPAILFGKPVIKNTRISVELILEKMADGYTNEDIMSAYPSVNKEDLKACLLFASGAVKNEINYHLAAS
jgi:uncharacterized protein (DUF433 family)